MKNYITALILSAFVSSAFGQIQLTQYFLDGQAYNPAFAGSQDALCANTFGRNQWMGLVDENSNAVSPLSMVFNIHAPVYSLKSGFGINVLYDKLGFETNFNIKLNYAYQMLLNNEKSKLGLGIGVSLLNKTIAFDQITLEDPNDPLLQVNQPASAMTPDVDLGVYYQHGNGLNVGLSVTNLLESSLAIGNVIYAQKRNLYFTTDYKIKLTENNEKPISLMPSVLVKSNFSNAQVDLSAVVDYNNQFWGGMSYRYQDAVALLAGVRINDFRLGVSYDITTGGLSDASKGSLEFFLGYNYLLSPKVKTTNNFNTRYL